VSLAALLTGDTVAVETYSGETAFGPAYESERIFDCRAQADRKLVRNGSGDEVVSEVTLYLPTSLPGELAAVEVFATESRVTVNGRQSQVVNVQAHRGRGAPVYVEVTTT